MEEKIIEAQNGNIDSIEEILKCIYNDLYKVAIYRLKNEMDAQDAVQNANILIYKNIKNLRDVKCFKIWATRILINECNKIFAQRDVLYEDINNEAESKDYAKSINEKFDTINILNKLNSEQDRIIMTLYLNKYKIKEIANILDMNPNTVKTRVKRCKEYLRKNLKYDRSKDEIIITRKTPKVIISSLLIILVMTGIVYALISITRRNKEGQVDPIKMEKVQVNMTEDEKIIKDCMKEYDENVYFLFIQDFQTFKEKEQQLSITLEDQYVNNDTFEKYNCDILLVTFIDYPQINLSNLLLYNNSFELEFSYESSKMERKKTNTFCIICPKGYDTEKIEIIYNQKENDKMPANAITYKYSEFDVGNNDEFDKVNIYYDKKQGIYYTGLLDKDEYKMLKEKLGIVTARDIADEELNGKSAILVFQNAQNNLKFYKFGIEEEKLCIYLRKDGESQKGKITGILVVFKNEEYKECRIIIK